MTSSTDQGVDVALLTAGKDKPYAFGLATALLAKGVRLDLVAGDDLNVQEFRDEPRAHLFMLRREPGPGTALLTKAAGILLYYVRLFRYAWKSRPTIFHILWNNKFETLDRVVLMLYYRLLGKKIVLTAHNVNIGTRDSTDTWFNRLTLTVQYRLSDHIFVHTDKMKSGVVEGFGVPASAVTVIPFGINNAVPHTDLTKAEARRRLGIGPDEKTILFFGNIAPYKGLEFLVAAFRQVSVLPGEYRLVVAGRPKKGFEEYWRTIESTIGDGDKGFTLRIEFIPDDETEVYFKAADVLALPYVSIFQSGVLFLGYSFGLPVLAADVGSLKDDVVEGRTGFVCASGDANALASTIRAYFASELFWDLENRRPLIRQYAEEKYSWTAVADTTRDVYESLAHAPQAGEVGGAISPRPRSDPRGAERP